MSITSITSDNISRDSIVNAQKPVPPTITGYTISASDDTALDPAGGQTVLINGSGFQRGATVNVAGVAIAAVSYISSNQLSFTTTARAAGTYAIYVVNADLGTAIFVPGLVYSNLPTWTTGAGSLGSYFETRPISNTVAASGDAPLSYSLASGSLPPGATLSSTGVISGNSPVESGSTTYSFTIEAVDAQNQSSTRSFSLTINTDVVTWSNPPSGATIAIDGTAYTSALSATSAAGYSVSYAANSLPAGLTLSGGTISGTPTTAGTTSTTLTATAATTNRSATNTITWVVSLGDAFFNLNTLLLSGSANTFVRDASTNNFGLTVFGDTRPNTFNPYLTGWSNSFTGSSDFLTLPSSSSAYNFGSGVDFTVEAWVYPTLLAGASWGIIDARVNAATSAPWIVHLVPSSGTYRLEFFNAGTNTGTAVIPLNTWTHVAVVRNGTALRTYVNGVLDLNLPSYGSGPISPGTTSPRVGPTKDASGTTFTNVGNISNLRIVNGTALYTSNFIPVTSPLTAVSGTSLLTCQSNRLRDASTNNFTITRNGNVTVDSFSPFVESAATNGSGFFDGNGDYITAPANAALQLTGDFTVEAWIYPTSLNTNNMVFGSDNGAASDYLTISTNGIDIAVSNTVYPGWSFPFVINQWYHIALTRSGSTLRAFVNGTELSIRVGSATSSLQYFQSGAGVSVGRYGFTSNPWHFTGYISNARIVKGTALYTASFTPPTSPLTAVTNTSLLTLQTNRSHTNNQLLDSSSENHFVTRAGNVTHGSFSPYSPSGWSNFFDGSGDFFDLPNNTAFSQTGSWTLECWVYPTIAQNNYVYSQNTQNFLQINISGTMFVQIDRSGVGNLIVSTNPIPLNAWTHLALVSDGTNMRLFINGTQSGSTAAVGTQATSATTTRIGAYQGTGTLAYAGYISNLRLVRGTALYTTTFTPPTQPLTAVPGTVLLTCADNRFLDDSVNRFALTRSGDVRIQNFSPFRAQTQVPTTYSAFFDGTGDYLTAPVNEAFNFGTGDFTIECWFNTSSLASVRNFVNNYNGAGTAGWGLQWRSDTTRYNFFFGDTAILQFVSTPGLNTWTHVAVSRSGTTLRMFVDGVLVANTTNSTNLTSTRDLVVGDLFVNGQGYAFPYSGYISNVRVVKGTALYTANFTPSTTPLTAVSGTSLLTCQSPTFTDNSSNRFAISVFGNSQPSMVNPFGSTFTNSTGYSVANHGGSVYFDGSGDNVTLASSPAFALPGDFTFETWLYPAAFQGQFSGTIFNIGQFSNGLFIRVTSTVIDVIVVNSQIFNPTRSTSIPTPNCWYHLAVVKRGSTYTLYVDGVSIGTATNSTAIAAGAVTIGVSAHNGTELYQGYLSDTRLVNGTALYTSNFVPPVAPLQAVPGTVLLLNGTGPAIVDASTKNLVETVGDVRVTSAVSRTGGSSMQFDGSGDRLVIQDSPDINLGSGDFTLECWVYFNVVNAQMTIINKGWNSSSAFASYLIWMENNGSLRFLASSNGGSWDIANERVIGTMTAGVWTHIAVTRSGTTFRAFVNGVINSAFTFTSSASLANIPAQTLFIGDRTNGGTSLNGYMQDVRITKGNARYTANFTPPAGAFQTS